MRWIALSGAFVLHFIIDMPHNDELLSRVTRTKQQAKASYDRISRFYDLISGGFESKYRQAGIQLLAPQEGNLVLEIGFGTGHAIVAIANSVGITGKVYGIDLSEGMLNIAHSKVKMAGLAERVVLKRGDAVQLPFETDFFDQVFISFTLELFDTPEIPLVLGECMRVLRTGGRICVVAMSKQEKPSVMSILYEWLHEKIPQYFDCRPIFVHESLREAGFQILKVRDKVSFGFKMEIVLAEKSSRRNSEHATPAIEHN